MVGNILLRGMLVGLVAGLLTFAFLKTFGEPQVDRAIAFESQIDDAKAKAAALGECNFFSAWMSQPKSQLETFRAWAGKDSDIR